MYVRLGIGMRHGCCMQSSNAECGRSGRNCANEAKFKDKLSFATAATDTHVHGGWLAWAIRCYGDECRTQIATFPIISFSKCATRALGHTHPVCNGQWETRCLHGSLLKICRIILFEACLSELTNGCLQHIPMACYLYTPTYLNLHRNIHLQ